MLNKVKEALTSPLINNTLKLSSSNVILYLLPIFVTPLLSRIYTPDVFGDWGIFASTFTIISAVMFGSYDNAIVKSQSHELKSLCNICIILGIGVALGTFILFKVGEAFHVPFFYSFPGLWWLILYLLIHTFTTVFLNKLNREGQYNLFAISNLINGISQGALRIILGISVNIFNGLIVGTVFAHLINLVYLKFKSGYTYLHKIDLKEIRLVMFKYKRFPMFDAPALLLQFAALNLPVIILSFFFSKSDIGCFSLIVQLLILPISFIGSAMGKVYYQQLSNNNSYLDESKVKSSTLQVFKVLSYLCIIPCLFIGIGGDRLIVWLLGSKWAMAGNMAICMGIWSIPTILTESFKSLFRIKEEQKYLMCIEGAYCITSIGILLVGCFLNWNLYLILISYAIICSIVKIWTLYKIFIMSSTSYRMLPLLSKGLIYLTIIIIAFRIVTIFF